MERVVIRRISGGSLYKLLAIGWGGSWGVIVLIWLTGVVVRMVLPAWQPEVISEVAIDELPIVILAMLASAILGAPYTLGARGCSSTPGCLSTDCFALWRYGTCQLRTQHRTPRGDA